MQFEPKDQFEQRQLKLKKIVDAGHQAYPHEFRWTASPAELAAKYAQATAPELESNKVEAAIAGRIVSYRLMGKAGFAHVQGGGGRLQIYVRKDVVGEKGFELFHLLDLVLQLLLLLVIQFVILEVIGSLVQLLGDDIHEAA